VPEGL